VYSGFPAIISLQGIVDELAPHFDWPRAKLRLWRRLERAAVQRARFVIAKSRFAQRWARERNPHAEIRYIPNALNPPYRNVEADARERTVLSVGTLCPHKGTDTLLRAFARVGDHQTRLVLAGDGDIETCRRLAADLGLSGRIVFLGHVAHEEIMRHMQHARVFAMASRMDTSPNALTEARVAGLAVVATRAGGIPDQIEHGRDGLLCGVDDIDGMARCFRQLLTSRALARALGQRARERALVEHDPDRIAGEHISFYRHIAQDDT
jgi:glycosyltransferase involved in cell wall biosynthesis